MVEAAPVLGIPPPPAGALEPDEAWAAAVSAADMKHVIERFLGLHGVASVAGSPLARWLEVLDEADAAHRSQTQFVTSMDDANQRRAHDLIEARRLAWSVSALYAPGRRQPKVDRSFITDQLLGADDRSEPDPTHRMPVGTFTVHLAARLQQAEVGEVRICGAGSRGVDLIYRRSNGGVALIEQKERAYYKSRHRDLESLVRDAKSRAFAAAEGLQAVTNPSVDADGRPERKPQLGARVVVVGTSPSRAVGEEFYGLRTPNEPSMMARAMTSWQLELSKRGPSFSLHAMLVFCMAHDIEPTTMVSTALGRFIDFHLVGGGICDEHWSLVAEVFQKMVPKRA